MKNGLVALLLVSSVASCLAADCTGSGSPKDAHEFFEHPVRDFKEVPVAARKRALTALAGRTVAPLSREAFAAYAGRTSMRAHRYLVRATAYTDRQNGGFTMYRHGEQVLALYTLVGVPGDCEASALVVEVDRPLTSGHHGAGAVR